MTTPRSALQLAGMALRNGVLVLGPTSWAVAVRDERSGEIAVEQGPRPALGEQLTTRVPLLRGPVRLANMLWLIPHARRATPKARLAMESPQMLGAMLACSIIGAEARRRSLRPARAELIASTASLGVMLAAMRAGDLTAYHGAEHKAIAGYEQGIPAAEASRVHPRCGTQLALPLLAASAIATQAALHLLPGSPRTARLVGQLAGLALSTELARRGARREAPGPIDRAGHWLQRNVTTSEPTPIQLAVAEAARDAVLEREPAS